MEFLDGEPMLTDLLVAFRFLTILRPGQDVSLCGTALGRSAVFFPFVGFCLGGVLWLVDVGLDFLPPPFVNTAIIACLIVLSGGRHLNEVAHTVTHLAERSPHKPGQGSGALGILGLVALLLVKIRAVDLLTGTGRGRALLLAPMLGRWGFVVSAYGSRAADELVRNVKFREFGLASLFTLAITFSLAEAVGLLIFMVLATSLLLFRFGIHHAAGGQTSESLGTAIELSETIAFLVFALASSMVSAK